MKLHRFYAAVYMEKGKTLRLPDPSLAHQASNVLKLKMGEKIVFFDGSGTEQESEIVSIGKDGLEVRVLETREVKPHSDMKVSIAFSLIKKDNTEWIIQKCTELGVSELIPLVSERSEKKGFNMERARKIMIEACEQSGRADIPAMREPVSLKDFLEEDKRTLIAFHTSGERFQRDIFAQKKEVVICIGPEGGWTDREINLFKEKGASLVFLDAPILRAETAAVSAVSLFLLL